MIVGLAGKAQAGKDTVGSILVKRYGFKQLAFADALRDAAYALDPIVEYNGDRLTVVVDRIGWDQAKIQYPEIRRTLQRFGTEVGRNVLGANMWVDALAAKIEPGHDYVITDVRFPNEYDFADRKGFTVRVERDGSGLTGDAALHPSETALNGFSFDAVIDNNGTLLELDEAVSAMLNGLQEKPPPGHVFVRVEQSDGPPVTYIVAKSPLV